MRKIIVPIVIFLFFISCDKKPRVILNTERYLVDSAYLERVDSIKLLIDSICAEMKEREYEVILDSIIQQRIAEIEKLHNQ
jgi:hypothetical protein